MILSKWLKLFLPLLMLQSFIETPDGGGSPPTPKSLVVPPDSGKETFSREYVQELREENKNWRLKVSALEKERDDHKTAAEKATAGATAKETEANAKANARILRSELKAEAIKQGMIDLDGLKLADLSKVTLKEDGTVDGAEALFTDLKKDKPYLFGDKQNSSPPGSPPPAKPPVAKKATEMTDEEYAAARKQFK